MARVEAVGWVVGERSYSFAVGHRSRVRSPGQRAPRRCNVEGRGSYRRSLGATVARMRLIACS